MFVVFNVMLLKILNLHTVFFKVITIYIWQTVAIRFFTVIFTAAILKVSFNSDMNNPVKTLPVLQVSSWSLGGQLGSCDP